MRVKLRRSPSVAVVNQWRLAGALLLGWVPLGWVDVGLVFVWGL